MYILGIADQKRAVFQKYFISEKSNFIFTNQEQTVL